MLQMDDEAPPMIRRCDSEPASCQTDGKSACDGDTELVLRVINADTSAFGVLFDRYSTPAYSLARRICVNEALAEDVVREVFLSFWREPGGIDPPRRSLFTWLMTMVHRRAVDTVRQNVSLRQHATTAMNGISHSAYNQAADAETLAHIDSGEVHAAMHALSEEHRRVLDLAYFEGHTQNEVATVTGLSLGTVKSRTFVALCGLRAGLSTWRDVGGRQDLTGTSGSKL